MLKPSLFVITATIASIPSLPGNAAAQGRLGVSLVDAGGNQGALVTYVERGSAAQKLICPRCNNYHHMTAGVNVITHVNGQFTGTAQAVAQAISRSGPEASLTIANLTNSEASQYRTQLSFGTIARNNRPVLRGFFQRRRQRWANANQSGYQGGNQSGGSYDPTNDLNLDFYSGSYGSSDEGSSGFSGLGSNFHHKQDRATFNRNYSTNSDHRR